MSQTIVIETQFFPPVYALSAIAKADTCLIETHENYQKRSFRNRCQLLGPNGITQISVPLAKGKHEQQSIQKVSISYDMPWHKTFIKLCQSHYGRSPYFDHVCEQLERLLLQKFELLVDLNHAIMSWIVTFMEIETELRTTSSYYEIYPEDNIWDMRSSITAKNYRSYKTVAYPQIFEERHGFINNVSILDLLFCMGKESIYYL